MLSELLKFSEKVNERILSEKQHEFLSLLDELKTDLNFPAVKNEVGSLLSFLTYLSKPKVIFEFGSGYGHSCFWYGVGELNNSIVKVYLTERRTDLLEHFNNLPWEENFRSKLHYHQGDAFQLLDEMTGEIDLLLMDGQKSDYEVFFTKAWEKLAPGGMIIVDNVFAQGKVLDQKIIETKKSVKGVIDLIDRAFQPLDKSIAHPHYLPLSDGIVLIAKHV